jgi:hypothetical protein
VIVPTVEFPPPTPLTLQLTLLSVVFVTVAVNVNWFPRTTEPVAGATVTVMEGGGGGGGVPAPPPPQLCNHAPAARRAKKPNRAFVKLFPLFSGRGRIPSAKQAKGQRKKMVLGDDLENRPV